MPKVKYVGVKPVKTDNVAGTKTIWVGNGDVQEVDEATWAKLAKHPDIWERVEVAVKPRPSLADVVQKPEQSAATGPDMNSMDKVALHQLAKQLGVAVHPASGADKVRAAILAAQK